MERWFRACMYSGGSWGFALICSAHGYWLPSLVLGSIGLWFGYRALKMDGAL